MACSPSTFLAANRPDRVASRALTSTTHAQYLRKVAHALALVAATGLPAAAQSAAAPPGLAVPAASIDAVAIDGAVVAVLKTSAMGERSLLVLRQPGGEEVLRKDGVTGVRLQLQGGHALVDIAGTPTVIDLPTGRTSPAATEGRLVLASCLTQTEVFSVVKDHDEEPSLVARPLADAAAPPETRRIGRAPADAQLFCASSSALVASRSQQQAVLWSGTDSTTIALSGREVLGVVDDGLYALFSHDSRTTIDFHARDGDAWRECGEIAALPLFRAVAPGNGESTIVVTMASSAGRREVFDVGPDHVRRVAAANGSSPLWATDGRSIAAVEHRDARPWIAISPLVSNDIARTPPESRADALRFDLAPDVDRTALALAWLERQLGPAVQTDVGIQGRLIDSYADDRSAGWTYDAALAAIAFTAAGRPTRARDLLAGLSAIQRDDGSWDFAYDPVSLRAIDGPRYVGSMAWVIMAVNFYEADTDDRTFSPMADRGLQFIDRFIVRDPGSPLDGGVSMGPAAPRTFSAEHNADAYSAFRWRGRLTGRADYTATADGLRAFILRELWKGDDPRGAYFRVGQQDDTLYLDPQTWTTLALAPEIDSDAAGRLTRALDTADRRLKTVNGRIGAVENVTGFRDTESADASKVWSEGSEGMVAARRTLGQTEAALDQHAETQRLQATTGGVIYATDNHDGWSMRPSVAGTAWFVLNALTPQRNPFIPGAAPAIAPQ